MTLLAWFWDEVRFDKATLQREGGWRGRVSFLKIFAKATVGCETCCKTFRELAKENGHHDGIKWQYIGGYTTWSPMGCGCPFRNKTKAGKNRMRCVLHLRPGEHEMSIPSTLPGSNVIHALNLCMDVPEGWKIMTPAQLQIDAGPALPAGWGYGSPYTFVARFPVQERMDAGLPYMNEKGWADSFNMIAESQGTTWLPKKRKAIEALVACSRTLYSAWNKIQEKIDQGNAPKKILHRGKTHTAEERRAKGVVNFGAAGRIDHERGTERQDHTSMELSDANVKDIGTPGPKATSKQHKGRRNR